MNRNRKKKKTRVPFRKNIQARSRQSQDWQHLQDLESEQQPVRQERVSGKGALTRRRTIIEEDTGRKSSELRTSEQPPPLAVDESLCQRGRVTSVHGADCQVQAEGGPLYRCVVRGLLKRLATTARSPVVVGDRVWFRPTGPQEGCIERVEPRQGILSREFRGREHILVANVDQLVIVASAALPPLKPNLIDRYLVSTEQRGIPPVICINKVDLVDAAELQPLVGLYSQLGYEVLLTSATVGMGLERLKVVLRDRQSALSGQSGVGKTSLLNAIQPGWSLPVGPVVQETRKGRHTTATARLLPLDFGGWVVDTPGIRQFQFWNVIPQELEGFFIEFRPFVAHCRFPDCTHTHEEPCAVKQAVIGGLIAGSRYESYLKAFQRETGDSP